MQQNRGYKKNQTAKLSQPGYLKSTLLYEIITCVFLTEHVIIGYISYANNLDADVLKSDAFEEFHNRHALFTFKLNIQQANETIFTRKF